MEFHKIKIGENEAGQRCDRFLKKYLHNSSRGNIFKMLRKKIIRVNGKKTRENYLLQIGDIVEFRLNVDTLSELTGKKTTVNKDIVPNFTVIYEDSNILIVNKPAGVIVHPDQKHHTNTLVDMAAKYLYDKGEYDPREEVTFSPASVNRLDLNTSGMVVFAKNYKSLQILNELMRKDKIQKLYLALVKGSLPGTGEIRGYLQKDPQTNKVSVSQLSQGTKKIKAREIVTRYKAIKSYPAYTLLEMELVTGRPHQIRAHLQSIKHPLAGDPKYGDSTWNDYLRKKYGLKRQFLHAHSLSFGECTGILKHLTGRTFNCALPGELKKIIAKKRLV